MKVRFGQSNQNVSVGENQCGACERVFGGLSAFEKHRRKFRCVDPITVGLVVSRTKKFDTDEGEKELPVWSQKPPRIHGGAALEGYEIISEGVDSQMTLGQREHEALKLCAKINKEEKS
jgi:hypothetical protein